MILVTGANGFVGGAVVQTMVKQGIPVRAASRSHPPLPLEGAGWIEAPDLGAESNWLDSLKGVECVVHLAARVHVISDPSTDPLFEFRRVNVEGTVNLAQQAAKAGVQRFVFLSSIKVNGESTEPDRAFSAADQPAPEDPYGISKHEAEQALRKLAEQTGMEVVIMRPPLIYGPGVKANFESMMRVLARGLPLPLATIQQNRRSLVALDNLIDLIMTCLNHPAAANQTFLVSDGEDLSTADLLRRMGQALGKPARLFPVPNGLLKLGAALLGKHDIYQRLCGSLQVDIGKTRQLLNWEPLMTVDEGLRRAAEGLRR